MVVWNDPRRYRLWHTRSGRHVDTLRHWTETMRPLLPSNHPRDDIAVRARMNSLVEETVLEDDGTEAVIRPLKDQG